MKRLFIIFALILSAYSVYGQKAESNNVPKDIIVNSEYYTHAIKTLTPLTNKEIEHLKLSDFTRLKNGENQFTYYKSSAYLSNNYNTVLIFEDFEAESACWIATYNTKSGNLIDYMEIYYDNAEGAWLTESKISPSAQSIILTEYDAYAEPEEKTTNIKISPTGKFLKARTSPNN